MAETRAYVLVETTVGHGPGVVAALRGMRGLISVDRVSGPYDVIIVLEAQSLPELAELVSEQVHAISGVVRTVTCLAMS
ncbi:MAG: Lrp/AsnC ligand binding domain-containing protein [Chloroflexi bacterium]|nr:Lrp/AsnC ligand binding domain-containing protein [Chloroflexota bacterium]MCI0778740.1 Lrp/AsnC ligand binding domain-containing protein [Chloroflexota bacterium]MCI0815810.1 Lrp/AsnC ligand binding domain-containing protein [Chloroflexota bacterium]MCI0821250.1 Lrp/AsnC ligand binding domain-containing protein [Chloroflexota bacterium]MCI0888434.1 Lrp/AsnC ligand binding domain-containing protein [Chloroflexota bacterium]